MSNRFAQPTLATLGRYRSERDALLRAARATYDAHGDAAVCESAWKSVPAYGVISVETGPTPGM